MSDKSPDWSLKNEKKKRRTQEIIRGVEAKRITQAMAPVRSQTTTADPRTKTATGTPRAVKTTTGELKRATGTTPSARIATAQVTQARSVYHPPAIAMPLPSAGQMAGQIQRRLLPVLIGMLVLLILALGAGLNAGGLRNATPIPTALNIPYVSAQDAIDYLKRVGVHVSDLRSFAVPNQSWRADQEYQFDVPVGDNNALFLILSYSTPARASGDQFHARFDAKYRDWQITQISNLLVLAPPDSGGLYSREIASHLTHFMVAPYVTFIATSTPAPPLRRPSS